jgi:uncharacterized protein YecA (UPF0149 family)
MSKADLAKVEEARRFADHIMKLNNFVARSLIDGAPEAVCPDPEDDRACREFCDAYLHMVRRADVDPEDESEVGHGLGVLAGYALLSDAELEEDLGSQKKVAGFKKGVRESLPEIDERKVPPMTVQRDRPKVGRNDPCPCGSGKKYKRCCGAHA